MTYCDKCKGKIVLHAFSHGVCLVCNGEIYTSHTPADKVCFDCAIDFNLCESCGDKIKKDEII